MMEIKIVNQGELLNQDSNNPWFASHFSLLHFASIRESSAKWGHLRQLSYYFLILDVAMGSSYELPDQISGACGFSREYPTGTVCTVSKIVKIVPAWNAEFRV